MFNLEIVLMAWQALVANKARTLLSMLGIIIGVATVISVVSIGAGAKAQVEEQFKNLSVTSLIVFPSRGNANSKLSIDDLETVLTEAQFIEDGNASISGNTTIAYGKESETGAAFGVTKNFFSISNLEIAEGRIFTDEENKDRKQVLILGHTLAENLFEDPALAINQTVKINNRQFEVIGVLKENGSSSFGTSYDDTMYGPFNTIEQKVLGKKSQVRLVFLAKDVEFMKLAEEEVTALLREAHKLRKGKEDDFRVRDPGSIVSSATETSDTLSFLLVSVASIVLIVSGIGIMNVMFVTVAERTKEIGILKAIGAQQKDILSQFLLESIILSLTGGTIGILLGTSTIPFLKDYGSVQTLNGILLGFIFSVLVGIFFGFYPALRASKLDPVDALRSE